MKQFIKGLKFGIIGIGLVILFLIGSLLSMGLLYKISLLFTVNIIINMMMASLGEIFYILFLVGYFNLD